MGPRNFAARRPYFPHLLIESALEVLLCGSVYVGPPIRELVGVRYGFDIDDMKFGVVALDQIDGRPAASRDSREPSEAKRSFVGKMLIFPSTLYSAFSYTSAGLSLQTTSARTPWPVQPPTPLATDGLPPGLGGVPVPDARPCVEPPTFLGARAQHPLARYSRLAQ